MGNVKDALAKHDTISCVLLAGGENLFSLTRTGWVIASCFEESSL